MLLFGSNLDGATLIGVFIAVLMGMTVHEFAHNYVAHLMGDPNPSRQGRLTLDPSVHINWSGFIMFLLIGFGPLGSAPISPDRMRNPRWGYMWAVAAGPLSNLLIAVVFGRVVRVIGIQAVLDLPEAIRTVLKIIIYFNIFLGLFNLLPLYPIDGWRIVYTLLPPDLAIWWQRNAQNTTIVLFILIAISFVLPPDSAQYSPLRLLIVEPTESIWELIVGFPSWFL